MKTRLPHILGTLVLTAVFLAVSLASAAGQASQSHNRPDNTTTSLSFALGFIPVVQADNPFFGRGEEAILKETLGIQPGSIAEGSNDPIQYLKQLITTIAFWLLSLLATISVLAIIYAGFLWVTSRGVPEQLTKAKQIIGYAIAGLLLAFFSYAIVTAVTGLARQSAPATAPSTGNQPAGDGGAPATPDAGGDGSDGPGGASATPDPDRVGGAPAKPSGSDPGASAPPADD